MALAYSEALRFQPAGFDASTVSMLSDVETAVPDHDAEIILYCGGGYRSARAADNLQRMGYTNVYSLAGGWKAWKDAGAPFEGE